MPGYNAPPEQWFARELAALKLAVAAGRAQTTQYVTDTGGVCQAIIGNLATDPNGASTGLAGWGVAVRESGGWIKLPELVNSAGASRFLQLIGLLDAKVAFGSGTLEWAVKSHESSGLTIATGLTSITSFVALSTNQVLVGYTVVSGGSVTVTGYQVAGEPAAGTKTGLYWVAIGQ